MGSTCLCSSSHTTELYYSIETKGSFTRQSSTVFIIFDTPANLFWQVTPDSRPASGPVTKKPITRTLGLNRAMKTNGVQLS